MDIDEITTFVAIAELGGFTRTAQRLHRTQPAISRRLTLQRIDRFLAGLTRRATRRTVIEAGRGSLR